MFLTIITLLTGISISAVAAYFSVIGLGEIFSAAFWSVVVMGAAIETGKVVACTWLHTNWRNTRVGVLHKSYLIFAIIITMMITSLGIFGFLSKSHLDQKAPIANELIQQDQKQEHLVFKKQELSSMRQQLDDLNKVQTNKSNQWIINKERNSLIKQMEKTRKEIDSLSSAVVTLKQQTSSAEVKLGPVKYLAGMIYEDPEHKTEEAIRILIIMIMVAFDPLALILIISAVGDLHNRPKNKKNHDSQEKDIVVQEVPEVIVDNGSEPQPEPLQPTRRKINMGHVRTKDMI